MLNQQSEKQSHTQRKTGLHSENWWLPTTLQLHFFVCTIFIEYIAVLDDGSWKLAVPNIQFLQSRLCCRDLGSNGPNDKHSFEER